MQRQKYLFAALNRITLKNMLLVNNSGQKHCKVLSTAADHFLLSYVIRAGGKGRAVDPVPGAAVGSGI